MLWRLAWPVWLASAGALHLLARMRRQRRIPSNPAPKFTVQTPIDRIAANERGKAVLDRDVPGVMSNPHYELFCSMSLSQLATLSGGQLTKTKLNQVNADLAELSPGQ